LIIRAREGDLVQIEEKWIFDVKGLVHPPGRVIAFPRYFPDKQGERKKVDLAYKKIYDLQERYKILAEKYPQYLISDPVFGQNLCEIPKEDISYHYDPISFLRNLQGRDQKTNLEKDTLHLIEFIQRQAGVSLNEIGISGSILTQLATPKSDIDLIIYGSANCLKVYQILKTTGERGEDAPRPYALEGLKDLYDFRSQDTKVTFNDFLKTESRKVLQGKFRQRDFFIRCIKDWNEIEEYYGDTVYREIGYAKVKATISDDSEAIFTPCRYLLEDVQTLEGEHFEGIKAIVSFRGRFCEQAKKGETVVAQGKVESLTKTDGNLSFRLLLGNNKSDFMVPIN
jgi:predicted nucleotidyltransferase